MTDVAMQTNNDDLHSDVEVDLNAEQEAQDINSHNLKIYLFSAQIREVKMRKQKLLQSIEKQKQELNKEYNRLTQCLHYHHLRLAARGEQCRVPNCFYCFERRARNT